jgi:hypothetical protein
MNTGPGDKENPIGVFVPAPGRRLCGDAVIPRLSGNRNNGHPGARARGWRTRPAGPGPPYRAAPTSQGTSSTGPANHPIRYRSGTERRRGGKARKSCWRRAGRGLLTVSARIWAGSRRGTRRELSDQRIGDRLQRACRRDGQRLVVTARQTGGFLAGSRHARPGRDGLRRRDVVVE